jgi:hypothetical protein
MIRYNRQFIITNGANTGYPCLHRMEEADRHEAKGSQHLPVALQKLDLSAWATGKRLNEAGPGANSKLGMLHLTHCFEGEGQILYTLLSERKLGGIVMYSASLRRLVAYIHLGLHNYSLNLR